MFRNHQSATEHPFQANTGRGACGHGWQRFGRRFGGGQPPWMKYFGNMLNNRVPVNIEEDEEAYHLFVYAPGLNKERFKVSVKEDVLSIAYHAPEDTANADKFAHHEYGMESFERLFQLSNKVLTDRINATYNEGILKVTLPRNPETSKPAQEVNIN